MRLFASGLLIVLSLAGGVASAQEAAKPAGEDACASFDWPLTREKAWFSAADLASVASGATLPADKPAAKLALVPFPDAGLPLTPSRPPKPDTFAGYVRIPASETPATLQVTLSDAGWVDVVEEGGKPLKTTTHSSRHGCDGLRKSVRFSVGTKPLVVMLSNVAEDGIRIAVTREPAKP